MVGPILGKVRQDNPSIGGSNLGSLAVPLGAVDSVFWGNLVVVHQWKAVVATNAIVAVHGGQGLDRNLCCNFGRRASSWLGGHTTPRVPCK